MAKATAKTVARPASGGNKAQQAARHQGRAEPVQRPTTRASVPATVAKPSPREVTEYGSAANLPDFMREDAGLGKEMIGREDLETPRLKLMQGLSPELDLYNELRPGMFFHTAAEHIFDAPFRAVIVFVDKQYILWNPLENGGGILARSPDALHWQPAQGEFKVKLDKKDGGHEVTWKVAPTVAASGLANWGTMNPKDPNSPPAATLMYNYVLAFPDHPDLMPAVLTFSRSSVKNARKLNTKLKTVRTPLFGMIWEFASVEDHNANNQKYSNINVTGAGLLDDRSQYMTYKQMYEGFSERGLAIKDIEGAQTEGDDSVDDGDDKAKY